MQHLSSFEHRDWFKFSTTETLCIKIILQHNLNFTHNFIHFAMLTKSATTKLSNETQTYLLPFKNAANAFTFFCVEKPKQTRVEWRRTNDFNKYLLSFSLILHNFLLFFSKFTYFRATPLHCLQIKLSKLFTGFLYIGNSA